MKELFTREKLSFVNKCDLTNHKNKTEQLIQRTGVVCEFVCLIDQKN